MNYNGLHFELGIRNLQAMAANFYAADNRIREAAKDLVRATAHDIRTRAQAIAPRKTGFMADHIKEFYTASGLGFEVGWDAGDFFDEGFAFYPFFQEFGTRHMAAQPSIGPAAAEYLPQFEDRMRTLLRDTVARLGTR